ncbi:MAG: hypothetical protein WC870_00570 [Candidatus Paceibacterota bacterium]
MEKKEGPVEIETPEQKKKEAEIQEREWHIGAIIVKIEGEGYIFRQPEIEKVKEGGVPKTQDEIIAELDKRIAKLELLVGIIAKAKSLVQSSGDKKENLEAKNALMAKGYEIIPQGEENSLEYALIQAMFNAHV